MAKALAPAAPAAPIRPAPVVAETRLTCKLIGHGYHAPEALQPGLNVFGTDMGAPARVGDRLYLLFGDTWSDSSNACGQSAEPYVSLDSDDLLGFLDLASVADPDTCLPIRFIDDGEAPPQFRPIQVHQDGERVPQLSFAGPMTAFSDGRRLYGVFFHAGFWPCKEDGECRSTARCVDAGHCMEGPTPQFRPRMIAVSREREGRPSELFDVVAEIDAPGFVGVAATVVNRIAGGGAGAHDYGDDRPGELLLFGRRGFLSDLKDGAARPPHDTLLLRASLERLAAGAFEPTYFAGTDAAGRPRWTERDGDAVPVIRGESERVGEPGDAGVPIHFPGAATVAVLPPSVPGPWRFAMMYGGRLPVSLDLHQTLRQPELGIYLRLAPHPWGPWTDPVRVFHAAHPMTRELIFDPEKPGSVPSDPNRTPRHCPPDPPYEDIGVEYAPAVLGPLARRDGEAVTLHWLMSTWNPYRVVQMRTRLTPR